jgi:hypothetical protein
MKSNSIELFETIADIINPYKQSYNPKSHNSIELPRFLSCIDEFGNRRRVKYLTEGQKVMVNEEYELQDLNDNTPTHQITHCWSIEYDTFGITVINLKTQELKKVHL